jgi:hypothetical protein
MVDAALASFFPAVVQKVRPAKGFVSPGEHHVPHHNQKSTV